MNGRAVVCDVYAGLSLAVLALVLAAAMPPVTMTAAGPAVPLAASHAGVFGPQPFVTVLCKFAGSHDEPFVSAYFDALLGDTAPGLGDYFREVSYGQISLQGSRTVGWYPLPRPARSSTTPTG